MSAWEFVDGISSLTIVTKEFVTAARLSTSD
jgi:hypothetical protein